MDGALNITSQIFQKYPIANMMFPNKTVIVIAKKGSSSSSQQMALLAGMAFIGGIVAGLLIRCIYHGIVKYFMSNVDHLVETRSTTRGNVNPSFVDDNFRHADDQPPDYVTVMTDSSTSSVPHQQEDSKSFGEPDDSKTLEELPPTYISVVATFARLTRSAST